MAGIRTSFCITLEAQHDLWCPVPSRSYVFGHVACVLFRIHAEAPGQSKIANLELAVGIHK